MSLDITATESIALQPYNNITEKTIVAMAIVRSRTTRCLIRDPEDPECAEGVDLIE